MNLRLLGRCIPPSPRWYKSHFSYVHLPEVLFIVSPTCIYFSTLYVFRDACHLCTETFKRTWARRISTHTLGTVKWLGQLREGATEEGGLNVPSIVPPLSINLCVEPVCDLLIDSDHDVGLVRSKAKDRERSRERTDRLLERCGSWPLNVPSEPV